MNPSLPSDGLSATQEHVILVAGPMGAGKTTAIAALSEIPVVRTEAFNSDPAGHRKATTTVALDYGEIALSTHERVRLYGVPGQERFAFMWSIIEQRAMGLLLLVDNGGADPLGDVQAGLRQFENLARRHPVVVGITRYDTHASPTLSDHRAALRQPGGPLIPVFALDARSPDQVRTLLGVLLASRDARLSSPSSEPQPA